ncbi:hypothetical protein SAMN05421820_107109 [Pedobacter steynii]|uniref:Transposase n=1 Tax=Pedobacter steynii TaxID=430522 RepID=A0A1H0AJ02_9SPHI|nr:hypothetical protein SAMN05421820_107109 [Pedobacter steynii]
MSWNSIHLITNITFQRIEKRIKTPKGNQISKTSGFLPEETRLFWHRFLHTVPSKWFHVRTYSGIEGCSKRTSR